VAEFSPVSASRLDVVATLVLGPADTPAADWPAGSVSDGSEPTPAPGAPVTGLTSGVTSAVWIAGSGEDEEAPEAAPAVAEDAAAGVERNAVISGATEAPLRQQLQTPPGSADPDLSIPFLPPLGPPDSGDKAPARPTRDEVLDEVSRWSSGQVPGAPAARAEGPAAGTPPAPRPEGSRRQPAGEGEPEAALPGILVPPAGPLCDEAPAWGADAHGVRALAVGLASMYLARERPAGRKRTTTDGTDETDKKRRN
jgi:hypothetical protein